MENHKPVTLPTHEPPQGIPKAIDLGERIRRLIERLAFEANRTAKSPSPDAVHDLRVAARRLEQGLTTFKLQLPRKAAKKIRKQLKAVLSAAGKLRDCEVAAKILSKMMQPGVAALQRHIRARRKDTEKNLLLILRRLSLRRRVSKWCDDLKLDTPLARLPAPFLRTMTRSTLPRLAQRFFEAGETAASQHSGGELHAFRILAKKFRYTLELFLPVYGSAAEGWLREIKSVQATLGAMNDYRTVQAMAAEIGSGKKLRAALKRSERRRVRQFREIWTARFTWLVAAQWIRSLRAGLEPPPPRKPVVSSPALLPKVAAARA